MLQNLGVNTVAELTPKAKKLYVRNRKLKSTVLTYKKRRKALMDRLRLSENIFNSMQTGLRTEALNFCIQQLTKKNSKPQGNRYTMQEKLMCLALYKASGSAYRFLSKWFRLPCARSISRMVRKIPAHEGLNHFVLDNLKKSVQKMETKDKTCCLIFDEVSILPSIEYDKDEDCLLGLKNNKIVDHALVFMIKGILTNWKQVIYYTFCTGTTDVITLKTTFKTLVQNLSAIGMYNAILK